MNESEDDAYCRQMEEVQYDDHARDTLRSIVHHLGPAECLRVIAELVTTNPAPSTGEVPF